MIVSGIVGMALSQTEPSLPLSKKQQYLLTKTQRNLSTADKQSHKTKVRLEQPIFARNLHTHEVVILSGSLAITNSNLRLFFRCWYTGNSIEFSELLRTTILNAAHHFERREVRIVSAFRHPKYNLILRKKGHQVARNSKHVLGQAVDFYLPGVPIKQLYRWLLRHHRGGIGFYPQNEFIHVDLGRKRSWRGK